MLKKIILFSLLSLTVSTQQINAGGDVTNAVSTTVALAGGCAAGYFSEHIFYKNPNGIFGVRATRVAKDWVRILAFEIKKISNHNAQFQPMGSELEKYIIGFRTATGVLTFLLIKLAYH